MRLPLSLFTAAVAVVVAVGLPRLAAARPTAPVRAEAVAPGQVPGQQFARAVAGQADRGFRVAGVDAATDGAQHRLEVVMARGRQGTRHVLEFGRQGHQTVAYRRSDVAAPTERRVYRFETELLALARGGAITSMQAECGSFFVEGPGGGSSVDPFDYYLVERSARGRAAQRLVAQAMGDRLEDGMRLAALLPSADVPRGATHAVDIAFIKGGEDVVHIGMDASGRIVSAEVRYSPAAFDAWAGVYRDAPRLERKLRDARSVRAIDFDDRDGGEPRLTLRLRGGEVFVIDGGDFELDDEDLSYACGC